MQEALKLKNEGKPAYRYFICHPINYIKKVEPYSYRETSYYTFFVKYQLYYSQ